MEIRVGDLILCRFTLFSIESIYEVKDILTNEYGRRLYKLVEAPVDEEHDVKFAYDDEIMINKVYRVAEGEEVKC